MGLTKGPSSYTELISNVIHDPKLTVLISPELPDEVHKDIITDHLYLDNALSCSFLYMKRLMSQAVCNM